MDNQKSPFKWVVLTVGTLFGIAHIGVLGHLMNKNNLPIINLPVGDYTSYTVEAGEEGYIYFNNLDVSIKVFYRYNTTKVYHNFYLHCI